MIPKWPLYSLKKSRICKIHSQWDPNCTTAKMAKTKNRQYQGYSGIRVNGHIYFVKLAASIEVEPMNMFFGDWLWNTLDFCVFLRICYSLKT